MNIRFAQMRPEQREVCAELAARAFGDYEYFSAYVPENRRRERFLSAMLRCEFRVNAELAAFFTASTEEKPIAVAMLCSPDYRKPSNMAYMKGGYGKVFLRGGIRNVSAWNDMEERALQPCRSLPGKVWYLNLLTVDPDAQGAGLGSRMLQEQLLPYARNRGGETLCLFTNSERNRRFYLKNGFEEFHARRFSYKGTELGNWSFRISLK